VAENCTGNSAACPNDAVATSAVECRASSGVCDAAEKCDGTNKACPEENYAGINGGSCDDGSFETENDKCSNGSCAGTQKPGNCENGITMNLPFEKTDTTEGRKSHISAYSKNCGNLTGTNPDMIYVLAAEKGETYKITVTGGEARIIASCSESLDCLGFGEDFEFTATEAKSYFIALESNKAQGGEYTIAVGKKEIVEPDDDVIDADAADDSVADKDIVTDIDTIITDKDTDAADSDTPDKDSVSEDMDIIAEDKDAVSEDKDATVDADNIIQPDETADETTNDANNETDIPKTDSDTAKSGSKSSDSGCGCSVIF